MLFDIVTIFPDFFDSPLQEGIIRRARAAKQISIAIHNIRDYAADRHQMTDDRPFGGGEGMVMKPEPLAACVEAITASQDEARVIALSPRGKQYSQHTAERLAGEQHLVLVCGRYEGIDQRFIDSYVDEEVSLGDYILTGGELAAMIMVDSITRLLPGVLGCQDSADKDTFSRGLLKHSQYTRPRNFNGLDIPQTLLSGNHQEIEQYRFLESVRLTLDRRPDLFKGVSFSKPEMKLLKKNGLQQAVKAAMEPHAK